MCRVARCLQEEGYSTAQHEKLDALRGIASQICAAFRFLNVFVVARCEDDPEKAHFAARVTLLYLLRVLTDGTRFLQPDSCLIRQK